MQSAHMPRHLRSSSTRGFTLVELMITVAILGILARIAIPQYRDYVTRGRIPEATSGLAAKQVRLEQYWQDNRTYVNAPDCASDTGTSRYFTFSCTSGTATATAYTLTAVGTGTMNGFTYSVTQGNAKSTAVPSGWTASTTCWVTKKDGSC